MKVEVARFDAEQQAAMDRLQSSVRYYERQRFSRSVLIFSEGHKGDKRSRASSNAVKKKGAALEAWKETKTLSVKESTCSAAQYVKRVCPLSICG